MGNGSAILKVLLIEDNPGDARLIREMLAEAKGVRFDLECADRLSTGLARSAEADIDVLLLDLGLPDSVGFDTFVKVYTRVPQVPIIVLTSLDDEAVAIKAVREGAQDYLAKGRVDGHLLARAISYAVERKRAEERLRLQSAAMESAANGIVIADRNGTILWVNPAFTWLTGYTAEEAIGRNPRMLKSGEHDSSFYRNLWGTILSGQVWGGEVINRRKDGSLYTEEMIITPVRNQQGEIAHFIAIKQDITRRKRAEEALRASEERFRALVQNSSDIIVVIDAQGTQRYVSPSVERVLGYKPAERTGKNVFEDVHPEDLNGALQALAEGLAHPGHKHSLELRYRHADGSYRRLEALGMNLLNGPSIGDIVINVRDITERKHAEEEICRLNAELEQRVIERTAQLEAANKELEAFSYSVSHDLRAPLRSIDGFSQALLEDNAGRLDAQGRDYLRRVRSASQHMGDLIDDLLKLSRITRTEIQHEAVDLSEMAKAIAEKLRQRQSERVVEIVIEEGLVVKGDSRLLKIMMENLLENAWKFTGRHPLARIELGAMERDGNRVYFVRDDGAGFDMAYANKLFVPFQRLHTPAEFPGTGIGLTTVQHIIHRHGGRVWAEGEVEKGATFHFGLP